MTQSRTRLSPSATKGRFAQDAEDTAARERTIQAKIDKKDKRAKPSAGIAAGNGRRSGAVFEGQALPAVWRLLGL